MEQLRRLLARRDGVSSGILAALVLAVAQGLVAGLIVIQLNGDKSASLATAINVVSTTTLLQSETTELNTDVVDAVGELLCIRLQVDL